MTGYDLRWHRVKIEGMNLSEFANFLNVSDSLVSKWENGHRRIPDRISNMITHLDSPPKQPPHAKHVRRYWKDRSFAHPAHQHNGTAIPPNTLPGRHPQRVYHRTTLDELSTALSTVLSTRPWFVDCCEIHTQLAKRFA